MCITPLISLMIDQKKKFSLKGIATEFVGEGQTDKDAIGKVVKGDIQLLYISPESILCNTLYRNMLMSTTYQNKLVALVVDEAHCIKMWYVRAYMCTRIFTPFSFPLHF